MLRYLIKNLLYRAYSIAQYQTYFLKRIQQHHFVVILSLHRVSPQTNYPWPPLTPKIFDNLLYYLKKHFMITTFHELENNLDSRPKLILSFDDGYYDFLEYAMPILKKHQLQANLNIIPSQLLNAKPLWNISLYDFIAAAPASLLKELRIPGLNVNLLKGKINKIEVSLAISHILKNTPFSTRDLLISTLEQTVFAQLGSYPTTRMLKLSDMPQIIAEHEIGAHSYSHNSMQDVDMSYFTADFCKCQSFFEEHHFPPLDIYAFPNGSYREEQLFYLKQNGIKYILLVGDQYSQQTSPFNRFNIAAQSQYEAIFQSLGIKSLWKPKTAERVISPSFEKQA